MYYLQYHVLSVISGLNKTVNVACTTEYYLIVLERLLMLPALENAK
jgi:hypothetical protein